jgi:hypothetical protein
MAYYDECWRQMLNIVLFIQQQQIFDIQHFSWPNRWHATDISQSEKIMLQQIFELKTGTRLIICQAFSQSQRIGDGHSGQY